MFYQFERCYCSYFYYCVNNFCFEVLMLNFNETEENSVMNKAIIINYNLLSKNLLW